MSEKVFETGVSGLDKMMGGGINWGSTVTIASDLLDRVTLCHQFVENALNRGFIVNYWCFKEAPERVRFLMEGSGMEVEKYVKNRQLQFFTPLETEQTRTLKGTGELLRVFNDFTNDAMKRVALHVMGGKKVMFVLNNVSALNDLLYEDPRWKDFTTKGATWLRRLVKVISVQISDMKDLEVAESIADFCIVMKNIDGIPYIKATKVSTSGWVPYIPTEKGIVIAEEFL